MHRVAGAVVDQQRPAGRGRDPGSNGANRGEQGSVSLARQRRDQGIVGTARVEQRRGERGQPHLDPAPLVMAGKQTQGGVGERFVDLDRLALDLPAHRGRNEVNQVNRFFRRDVVEFEPEPAEAVAAASARDRQRHCHAGHRLVLVADQLLDQCGRTVAARVAAGRGDQLLVGARHQQFDQRRTVELAAAPQLRNGRFAVALGGGKQVGSKPEADFVGDCSTSAPSIADIKARSCSVNRARSSRNRSSRTTGRRSRPARRAG